MKIKQLLIIAVVCGSINQTAKAGMNGHRRDSNYKDNLVHSSSSPADVSAANTAGTLDNTFGRDGTVLTAIDTSQTSNGGDFGQAVAVQSDGKIVMAGYSNNPNGTKSFVVARFDSDGTIDNTFGKNGWAKTYIAGDSEDVANAVAIQPDGKIVLAGSCQGDFDFPGFAIARFNSNGTIDSSFGENGSARVVINPNNNDQNDIAYSIMIQPDGKIIAAGQGNYTDSLNNSGNTAYYGIEAFALARFNSNGKIDYTFGTNGTEYIKISPEILGSNRIDSYCTTSTLLSNGNILLAGYANVGDVTTTSRFIAERLDSSGKLDSTFGKNGFTMFYIMGNNSIDKCSGIAVQQNGGILLGGTSENLSNSYGGNYFAIARLKTDGSIDTGFGNQGAEIVPHTKSFADSSDNMGCNSICLQPDGKIIEGGFGSIGFFGTRFTLIRINTDGTIDSTFGTSGWSFAKISGGDGLSDIINGVAISSDGKIIAAGSSEDTTGDNGFAVARFLTENSPTAVSASNSLPASFQLSQNYPNPFNPSTKINYTIPRSGIVSLKVYDITGRLVRIIVSGYESKGEHRVEFNADNFGFASGVYFYRLKENDFIKVKKMVLLK